MARKKPPRPMFARGKPKSAASRQSVRGLMRPAKAAVGRVVTSGLVFDNATQADRYDALRDLERDGLVRDLARNVSYPLRCDGGRTVAAAEVTFVYAERAADGSEWVGVREVCREFLTDVQRLKIKWLEAQDGVPVRVVTRKGRS